MLGGMPTAQSTDPRLDQARELIREKGLSRQDILLLDEILREGGRRLCSWWSRAMQRRPGRRSRVQLARLRRSFGLFLVS